MHELIPAADGHAVSLSRPGRRWRRRWGRLAREGDGADRAVRPAHDEQIGQGVEHVCADDELAGTASGLEIDEGDVHDRSVGGLVGGYTVNTSPAGTYTEWQRSSAYQRSVENGSSIGTTAPG